MKKYFINILERILPLIIILIIWFICSTKINPLFLPSPTKVVSTFLEMARNGILFQSLWASFVRITMATLIAGIISIPLGILTVEFKFFDRFISTLSNAFRYIPPTAFYALYIMWFGIDEKMKLIFLFTATFVYFLPTVVLCLKEVNKDLIETAYTIGMNKLQVMIRVLLAASLPSILESFLMMYAIGWTYVVIAEIVNAKVGLGFIIQVASARGNTAMVFASILTIVLFSFIFDTFGNYLIRKIFPWKFAIEIND